MADCRGQMVVVEGLGPTRDVVVVRWPSGVLTREREADLRNERVVQRGG